MKKVRKYRKLLSSLLIFTLILSMGSGVFAAKSAGAFAKEADQYKIYPIPQSVTYGNSSFIMSEDVNVVAEEGIDKYTVNFLKEVLEKNDRTMNLSEDIVSGKTNILLGVKESGGVADTYVADHITRGTADLFEKNDPYLLSADTDSDGNEVIAIVGKDTDCTFYGIATLQMMLSSFNNKEGKILDVQIEDYAGVAFRGFIEGFYGGWDYASRASLMRFARDVKMNNYVYASKTDVYHTSKWNELYPQSDIDQIKELVEVGKETKCYYAWSVHLSGFFNGLDTSNEEAYNTRYNQLTAKFQQLYDAGVRKFDILNDDFGKGSHADVVALLNKLTKEFIEPKGCKPLTYCPQGYNEVWSKWSSNASELETLKGLDPSISIYWTGADVNSPITQSTIDYVKEKSGHEACFWINYPVNEHAKSGIYLGDITYYARDGVTGMAGAVSNPSRFAESNKVGLFQLAALFWNNKNYSENAQTVWEDAFRYLEPEVEDSYFKIASNVSNCPHSSRIGNGFPESEYLKDTLASVLNKINSGAALKNDSEVESLISEMDKIVAAVADFKENCTNKKLVQELNPWLSSLNDVATGIKAILKSAQALQENDAEEAWTNFGTAAKALNMWNTYNTGDGTTKAEAGSKRLQPFLSEVTAYVKNNLTPLMDSSNTDFTPKFYAVLGGTKRTDDAQSAKIFDGDETTAGLWNTVQKTNDYYGVDMGRVLNVTDISILQGSNDTDHDYFHKAILEYSENGEDWTQIGEQYNDTLKIERSDLDITARYVRLRLAATGTSSKADYWTHVREFTVNKKEVQGERIYTNVDSLKQTALTVQGKEYSVRNLTDLTLNAGEYVGIKMTALTSASAITAEGTGLDQLAVQYSTNGVQWSGQADFTAPAVLRYIRIVNNTDSAVTCDLEKLGVTAENLKMNPSVLEHSFTNALKEGKWDNLFDGDRSTYAWTNEAQQNGEYLIIDLGATVALYDVNVVTGDGNPRFYNAVLEYSKDKTNWTQIGSVANDNSEFVVPYRFLKGNAQGADAKYIRIRLTGNSGYYLKIHEVEINKEVSQDAGEASEVVSSISGNAEKCVDGDISSVFTASAATVDGDYLEYRLTENTKLRSFSILQDAANISDATVKVLTKDGYEKVGTFDKSAKKFDVSEDENIFAIRLEWTAGRQPSIYEIFTDKAGKDTDDIGEYVPHIILDGDEEETESNIALNKTVTVSGTETASVVPSACVDGNESTKWDSNVLKGSNAPAGATAWVYVDLGETKTSIINSMTMKYFNKVYPTASQIQVSNDHENWITVKSLSKNAGLTNQTDTYETETPLSVRYVRLLFTEINSRAAGNAIGLKEFEIYGIQSEAKYQVEAAEAVEGITVDKGTEAADLNLPKLVSVQLKRNGSETAKTVQMPVVWNTENYNAAADGVYTLEGIISLNGTVQNTADVKVQVAVTVGSGQAAPDKTELAAAIAAAEEIDRTLYTKTTAAEFVAAYESAVAVNESEDADQAAIDEAKEALLAKKDALLLKITTEKENLSLNKPVTVSGTTNGRKENCVDGDDSTKWDSNLIKGSNATDTKAWVVIDLGEDSANLIDKITAKYFNKVYPMQYEIQVSDDNENWTTVKALSKEAGLTGQTDVVEFEQPVAGRYVRFYFTELNSEAYGDGIGINEITVEGRKINETAAVTEVPALDQIEVAKGTTAEEIRDQLPATVTVKVTVDGVTEPVDVVLPVQWDLSAYSGEKDATYTLQGTLVTQGTIAEAAELPAEVTVKVGTGEEVVVNKETLRTVLEALEEKDLSGYTEESVAALQAALQTAEAVLADESADQAAVDQALAALQAAKEGLKVKDNSGKDDSGKDDPGKNDPGKNDPDKNDPGKNDPGKTDPGSDQPAADVPSNGTTGNDAQTSGKGDAGQKNTAVKTGDSSSGVYAELMLLSLAMGCAGIYLKKKEKNR